MLDYRHARRKTEARAGIRRRRCYRIGQRASESAARSICRFILGLSQGKLLSYDLRRWNYRQTEQDTCCAHYAHGRRKGTSENTDLATCQGGCRQSRCRKNWRQNTISCKVSLHLLNLLQKSRSLSTSPPTKPRRLQVSQQRILRPEMLLIVRLHAEQRLHLSISKGLHRCGQ
jgi:hypothetical protein